MACAFASHANRTPYSNSSYSNPPSEKKVADVIRKIRATNADLLSITGGLAKVGVTERNKPLWGPLLSAVGATGLGINIDQAVENGAVMMASIRRRDMPTNQLFTKYDFATDGRRYVVMVVTSDGIVVPPVQNLGSGNFALGPYKEISVPTLTQYGSAPCMATDPTASELDDLVYAIVYVKTAHDGGDTDYQQAIPEGLTITGS